VPSARSSPHMVSSALLQRRNYTIKLHLPHTCRIQQTFNSSVLHTELLCIELALAKDSVSITSCPWLHAWWPYVQLLLGTCADVVAAMQAGRCNQLIQWWVYIWAVLCWTTLDGCAVHLGNIPLCANGALARVRLTPHVLATCTCTSTLCKYDLHMMFHQN
jgi:hypothetical protein